jgi:hypothetical protein
MKTKIDKSLILISLFFLSLINQALGQAPCPLNGQGGLLPITTNPVPYIGQNYKTNTWDWKQSIFPIYKPDYTDFYPFGEQHPLANPYFNVGDLYTFYANGANSEFYSEDGWELIKRDFGYLQGENNVPSNYIFPNKAMAYFILYNRYSNILRVLATLPSQSGTYGYININLQFANPTQVSALLGNYKGLAQTTDQRTKVIEVTTPARFPAAKSEFMYADFLMAYDPCTCQFTSGVKVTFTAIQRMKVDLYGRLLATGIPISDIVNGNGSFYGDQNPEKFLTSIYKQGINPEAGIQTYKRIDDLKTDYINAYQNQNDKNILDLVFKGLKIGAAIYGLPIPDTEANKNKIKAVEKIGKSIEILSSTTDFFSSIFGEKEEENKQEPIVIQGELTLSGEINNAEPQQGLDFAIANPGSLNSQNAPEFTNTINPNPAYPMYNEVLGTFALIEQPKIESETGAWYMYGGLMHYFSFFKLATDIKYVFNPAARVNLANSRLKGSIFIKINGPPVTNPNYIRNLIFSHTEAGGITVYRTPFLPLECLNDLVYGFANNYPGSQFLYTTAQYTAVHLKIIIDAEHLDKKANGNLNRSMNLITYPLNHQPLFTDPMFPFSGFGLAPGNAEVASTRSISTTEFSSNENLYTWSTVDITGDLTVVSPNTVNIYSTEEINVNQESTIEPGITLQIGTAFTCTGSPTPYSGNMTTYCNGTGTLKYQANIPVPIANPVDDLGQAQIEEKTSFITLLGSAFPNPTDHQTYITVPYQIGESAVGSVRVYVSNMLGERVAELVSEAQHEAGQFKVELNTTHLPAGVYYYTLETSQGKETKRLMVVK